MRYPMLALAALLVSSAAMAQMGGGMPGGGGGRGGHGGGEEVAPDVERGPARVRPPKPLRREKFDKLVTAMFREADANHDGIVTLAELQGVIDARREALIRARFKNVDRNHNGTIEYDEFSAWQRAMGSLALSEGLAAGDRDAPVPEFIGPELGDAPDDRTAQRLIVPLSATVVAEANTNYDAGVSLDELLAYEHRRFDAADADHDGEVTAEEMRDWEAAQGGHGRGGPPGGRRPPPQ